MSTRVRRTAAVVTATVVLGIGAAAWATSSASAASAATPRCTAGNLAVWVNADSENGAAGTIFYHLDFTNISGHTCHLFGYPGVSATNFNGKQLGPAARRDNGVPATTVNIVPGGTAHATLGYVDVQVDPSCHPVRADVLRVFAPNTVVARHAFFDLPVCTTNRIDLTIRRVQPGA
jgi:Protein of unknown function (DUF4232)